MSATTATSSRPLSKTCKRVIAFGVFFVVSCFALVGVKVLGSMMSTDHPQNARALSGNDMHSSKDCTWNGVRPGQ